MKLSIGPDQYLVRFRHHRFSGPVTMRTNYRGGVAIKVVDKQTARRAVQGHTRCEIWRRIPCYGCQGEGAIPEEGGIHLLPCPGCNAIGLGPPVLLAVGGAWCSVLDTYQTGIGNRLAWRRAVQVFLTRPLRTALWHAALQAGLGKDGTRG